jgi:hypothetical protein
MDLALDQQRTHAEPSEYAGSVRPTGPPPATSTAVSMASPFLLALQRLPLLNAC